MEYILKALQTSASDRVESQVEQSDTTLLLELRRGNSRALSEVFRRYESGLVGYLYRRFGNLDLARDIVQDTFMKLIKRPPRKCHGDSLKPWLYRVARNLAIDAVRKGNRLTQMDSIPGDQLQTVPPKVLKSEASELVQELPKEQLEVVLLRIYGDMKFSEIAEQLDIPLGTALWRMRQALASMRKSLESDTV